MCRAMHVSNKMDNELYVQCHQGIRQSPVIPESLHSQLKAINRISFFRQKTVSIDKVRIDRSYMPAVSIAVFPCGAVLVHPFCIIRYSMSVQITGNIPLCLWRKVPFGYTRYGFMAFPAPSECRNIQKEQQNSQQDLSCAIKRLLSG